MYSNIIIRYSGFQDRKHNKLIYGNVSTFVLVKLKNLFYKITFYKKLTLLPRNLNFNRLRIGLKLFYIEVFVIIQITIFLDVWPKIVKSTNQKCSLRQWINLFSILMRVFDLKLLDRKWKIQKSNLASWSFGSQWPIIWTLISSCIPIKFKPKPCPNRPYALFKT